MEAFALYLFRSVVWLTGFALVYLLFLRNERYFLLNRVYLLAGIVASIVFPFFTWHYTVVIPFTPTVEVSELQMTGVVMEPEAFPTKELLLILYMAGSIYLLYRIIRQTVKVIGVIRHSEILPYRSAKLIRTPLYPASFSFFSFVFVNPSSSETETREIVNHELEHVRQRHWIDLVLFELLCTLQWLNPLCWLYGRFIRQNHEFLADQHALQRSANPAIYRAALINQLFGGEVISLANSFSYSINKKRFHMMKNTIQSPIRKLKLLLILPIMAGVFYAFAMPEYRYANGAEDQKPAYTIAGNNINIPFTNQMTKGDLEAIKTELEKVGLYIDYTSLDFTKEGKLKAISASINHQLGGIASFASQELTASNYPIFKMSPNGDFGIYYSTVIKGTVYNEKGAPLPRVAVIVNGSNRSVGTITNDTGEFELKGITQNETIVFSYVGYESIEVKAEAGRQMIINMKPANIKVEEVTITGLATNSGQNSLGSSIKVQTNSPLQFGSKDGTQPLIVIDGVITDNANVNNIPPETIESISVLKNASSTAVYGDKGKNGVILINTKKGITGAQNNLIDVNLSGDANAQKDRKVYSQVEQMPEFPGGDMALRRFIATTIKYPMTAADNGIQGKVFVTFVVDKTGKVSQSRIVRGVDPSLDKEALRVVNSLPQWKPGKQGGKEVDVEYTVPINFVLQGDPKKSETSTKEENPVFFIVEQMPEYPGGDAALRDFIARNVKYPAEAMQKGIQGKVYVNFTVSKTGSVANAKIARGVDPLLDQEAIRVVNLMPRWTPGKQKGEAVNVSYTVPISFVLEKYQAGATESKDNNKAYTIVEEMPQYPGGPEALRAYIASSLKYPTIALENGIHGQVIVSFIVDKTGSIPSAKIIRGVDPSLDKEALRVVNSMPKWTPGKQNGENVDVAYELPINFKLPADYGILREKRWVSYRTGIKPEEQASENHQLISNGNVGNGKTSYTLKGSDYNGIVDVRIYDRNGKLVKSESKNGPTFSFSNNDLPVGDYFIYARAGSHQYTGGFILTKSTSTSKSSSNKKAEIKPTVNQAAQVHELIIVPNPTSEKATITLKDSDSKGQLQVSVFDKDGKLIRKESKTGPTFNLSFASYTSGNYFIVVKAGNEQHSGHLIVNH